MKKTRSKRNELIGHTMSERRNGLVNGNYGNNTVNISESRHWSIRQPEKLALIAVSLMQPVPVAEGDVLTGRFLQNATSNGINSYWYFRINGNNTRFNTTTQRPQAGTEHSVTLTDSGTLSAVVLQARAEGMLGEFDFSLKKNGEVIV